MLYFNFFRVKKILPTLFSVFMLVTTFSSKAYSYIDNQNLFELFKYEDSPIVRDIFVTNLVFSQNIIPSEIDYWANSYSTYYNRPAYENIHINPLHSCIFYNKIHTFEYLLNNAIIDIKTLAFLICKANFAVTYCNANPLFLDVLANKVSQNYGMINRSIFSLPDLNCTASEREDILTHISYISAFAGKVIYD